MEEGYKPYHDPALDELSNRVIGAAIEVHRALGPGFLESVYEQALCVELHLRGIPHQAQVPVSVLYKGHAVGEGRMDVLIDQRLIVELKAVESILPVHKAQILSYLKASRLSLGLLINFNVYQLKHGIHRMVLS